MPRKPTVVTFKTGTRLIDGHERGVVMNEGSHYVRDGAWPRAACGLTGSTEHALSVPDATEADIGCAVCRNEAVTDSAFAKVLEEPQPS